MDRIRPTDTTEERIENLTDSEASAIFREAFYAEAKALEKKAMAHPVEVDEEQMEALRRRILQNVGAEVDDIEALEKELEGVPERMEEAETSMPKDVSPVGTKQKQRRFSPLVRWAAVLILACVGVLGVSMSSQAKESGLWSSIQRLIGVETRWEQENNGEDRTYTNPEEYKAIDEIEEKLEIDVPEFFYWPGEMAFSDYQIIEDSGKFLMIFTDGEKTIFFEGWKGIDNASSNSVWKNGTEIEKIEYDGITYTITKASSDEYGIYYAVRWITEKNKFSFYGVTSLEDAKKIIENIKK